MQTRCRALGAVLTAAAIAAGCARHSTTDSSVRTARMVQHFARAGQLYAAIAKAALDSVRLQARWIMEHETGQDMPERARPYAEQLRAFTSLAARAPDVESAASAVAQVGAACGACHQSLKRGPRYRVVGDPPTGENAVTTRMIRHRWAADRLWEGLIGPSDLTWSAGASVLRDAPLYTDALTDDVAQYEAVTKLAWTVHAIGARAGATRDRQARAELYGQLLGTCARCHDLLQGAD